MNGVTTTTTPLKFIYDDGGRETAKLRGKTGDCAVRAVAIVTGLPYRTIYMALKKENPLGWKNPNYTTGTPFKMIGDFLVARGFRYHGQILRVASPYLQYFDSSLPRGRLVVLFTQIAHVSAVIDHTIYDTFDPARGGILRPRVSGYWQVW